MKHILSLMVIILSSYVSIFADDDDWIDGITYRLKAYQSSLTYNYVSPLTGEQHMILTSSANGSLGLMDRRSDFSE